jgi:hypothetical protein
MCKNLNIFGKWKTNSTAIGLKPCSAQLQSGAWPMPTAPAWPVCTAHAAHGLLGRPRPRGPRRHGAARRVSARWSGHRSPGVRRSAADDGATVAEAEQKAALEHPRWRGYPLGMGVEAIAHRSSLSTGRGRKTGSVATFSDEVRAPVAGGGPTTGRRRRVCGGGGAETMTAPGGTAHLARRRPVTTTSARLSNNSGGEPRTAGRQLRTG